MKVLCKKSYEGIYTKNKWYKALQVSNNEIEIDSEFVYNINFRFINRKKLNKIKNNDIMVWIDWVFEDYFYTLKELRKFQLKQLNESTL